MTRITDLAEQIADLASSRGLWVAAAESLTGGAVSSALAAAPGASDWYHGGVVAYSPRIKQHVLGVTPGSVVTAQCADELAAGVARVLESEAAVSTTGVGGPDPEEGEEPGTVYLGVVAPGYQDCRRVELEGSPDEVVEQATEQALELLLHALQQGGEQAEDAQQEHARQA
ncbi:CinA family protein [Ornithinimicrobium sufpigmenti]|uniref:CinA family protein n=1 Tax=Ornithinimicrobium sufpigmenti TaxID=2508882 RepID=UPI001035EE52|nr:MULTISPECIES: CinA family protein [unclassified Ornithinimicrobium]